jgi:hypothetical protein
MMEFMSQLALEVGAERRREVALDTMRQPKTSNPRLRRAAGAAVIAVGRRISGEFPATSPKLQASGDCL